MSQERNDPWQGLTVDGLIHRLGGDFFVLHPMLPSSGLAISDNNPVRIDRVCAIHGGLVLIQEGNEVPCNHKGLAFFIHVLVAVGLISLFLPTCS